jgi:NADP-dependent aldehyde dehydrogenase
MHHGGPFPATTDSRFTSVGVDAIKRFARPLALQNWPDHLLPTELQDANLAGLLRMVNGVMTTEAVIR